MKQNTNKMRLERGRVPNRLHSLQQSGDAHPMSRVFLAGLMILLTFSCERADPVQPQPIQVTFSSIQTNIFNQNCVLSGCHLGGSAPLGLDLSEGVSYNLLVNVASGEVPSLMRVKPGDPENSYLVHKIEGRPSIVGDRMPRGRPDPLAPEEIQAIRDWISEGAPNN